MSARERLMRLEESERRASSGLALVEVTREMEVRMIAAFGIPKEFMEGARDGQEGQAEAEEGAPGAG